MVETFRLFVALELPQSILTALEELQDSLQSRVPARAVRWTRPEGIHLTLKFLGDTPAAKVSSIEAALDRAVVGHVPMQLIAAGLGCFPNTHRPRVVWVGLEGYLAALELLHESVDRALTPLGFEPESRGFNPHLTLGRVRREAYADDIKALGNLIELERTETFGQWTADAVRLIRSDLNRDGAVYTTLHEVKLTV